MTDQVFDVTVWVTTVRPINVDAQKAFVRVVAANHLDAEWLAIAMVMASRPFIEMPTRTAIVKVA